MRVLISNLFFGGMTGSEISTYELSKELVNRGHQVLVMSMQKNKPFLTEKAESHGVEVTWWEEVDTNWNPDVLICGQAAIAKITLKLFKGVPAIEFVRSEFQEIEAPAYNKRIKKYICNRPTVQEKLIKYNNIPREMTTVIWNGFDFDRFRLPPRISDGPKRILFVGGHNHIRLKAMEHLVGVAKEQGKIVRFVGAEKQDFMNEPHVEMGEGGWNIEGHIAECDETAGILVGRTTIEGWIAGRPGHIYWVNWSGDIEKYEFCEPPEDIDKFNIKTHAKLIENELLKIA